MEDSNNHYNQEERSLLEFPERVRISKPLLKTGLFLIALFMWIDASLSMESALHRETISGAFILICLLFLRSMNPTTNDSSGQMKNGKF